VRLRDGVEWRHVDDEILALDTASSTFFNTNRAGALLWSELSEGRTRADLVEKLVMKYDIEATTARRDLDAFLDSLARHGLLR
jgi:enolase